MTSSWFRQFSSTLLKNVIYDQQKPLFQSLSVERNFYNIFSNFIPNTVHANGFAPSIRYYDHLQHRDHAWVSYIGDAWKVYECFHSLQWHHNERHDVSIHRRLGCLLNRLFWRRPKKISKLRVTGLCEGNSPVTYEFPAQRASMRKMFPFDCDVVMLIIFRARLVELDIMLITLSRPTTPFTNMG